MWNGPTLVTGLSIAEVTAKNRDLNHKPKYKTTIWGNHVHTFSLVLLPLEGETIYGQSPRLFFLLWSGWWPILFYKKEEGLLLTPEAEIAKPGQGLLMQESIWLSPSSLSILTSEYALGCTGKVSYWCHTRPKIDPLLVPKLLKSTDFICLVPRWIVSSTQYALKKKKKISWMNE